LKQSKNSFAYYATEHFRMSGVYWGVAALYLMDKLDDMNREEVITWVLSCQHDNGGFGGSERHDPHMLYTLSALQILALYDQLDKVDADKIAQCEFI
jgi:geranylgeranyl transferase type-2 subunit beta